ncbi:MAG: GNAT family N-acetyltransferase [archaeon]|nr:GNAT family N-acetyltransferase [archaeon]MCR4323762.1 GNAT family N-acetyltransferase [Nanoarchaeota archaeon]
MSKITFYKEGDYKCVKNILQESNLYDKTWEAEENLKRKINRDPESILVAKEGEKIIGCVFIVEDGWNGFIWRLSVDKNWRRKGVGILLMKKAEEIIKKRGIKEASLFIGPKNDSLREWYEKQDYEKTSDWTFMYKKL